MVRTQPLSTKPTAIRARLRRKNADRDIEMLANSRKPLDEWDIEELARGRPRDSNGKFTGHPPKWITPAILKEAQRRFQGEAIRKMSGFVGSSIKVIASIMMDPDQDAKLRMEAAKFIIEHVIGKATTRVEIEAGENARMMLAAALVMPDGQGGYQPAGGIIEGESEWADEDDDLPE